MLLQGCCGPSPNRLGMFEPLPLQHAVAKQFGGGTPSRQVAAYWHGPIPWASVKDFVDGGGALHSTQESITNKGLRASASKLVPAGTPLVCTRMAVGRSAVASMPVAINQDVKALAPAHGTTPAYLLRLLQYVQLRADAAAVGSTVKGIRIQDYLSIVVPMAPSEEQARIVEILDTIDTTIRQTEVIIEKLKQVKQGLLHDLLTRGIDANGELRPPQNQAPHLYKDSPLGWIPRGWTSPNVRWAVEDVANGASIRADEFRPAGTPVIAKGDVTAAKYIDTNARSQFVAPTLAASKYKASMINSEFVVCSMRDLVPSAPTLGMASLLDAELDGLLAQGTTAFRLDTSRFNAELFVEVTRLPWFRTTMRALAVGSTQVHMRGRDYLDVAIPAPPIDEQQEIVAQVRAIDCSVQAHHESAATLKSAKSGLMADLLTGRVRVTPLLAEAHTM